MTLRINTNVAALNAHKNLIKNDNALSASLEKLSSGLRINKAADDASGMAIADSLRSQGLGLGQAIRNANDGISMVQTADGALEESINIVNTIKTKAIQAAQDGQTTDSRKAIQSDINKLMSELDMIAKTTSFNGQKLLSGVFTDKKFQVGAFTGETVGISIGSSESTKTGHLSTANLTTDAANGGEVRLTITSSIQDLEVGIKSVELAYNNSADNGMGALADAINTVADSTGVTAQANVSSTSTSAVAVGSTGSDFAINGIAIGEIAVDANDVNGTLVTAINQKSDQHGVTASVDASGFLTLTSSDGRAIQVQGSTGTVLAGSDMSTFGSIKLFQIGANEIKVSDEAETVSLDLTTSVQIQGDTTTNVDSTLVKDSVLESGSILKNGSTLGFAVNSTALGASVTTINDSFLSAGSVLASNSVIEKGSILGGVVQLEDGASSVTAAEESLLKTGTVLASNSVLTQGTTVTTRLSTTVGWIEAGETLGSDVTVSVSSTLSSDLLAKANSVLSGETALARGSYVGADITTSAGGTTMDVGMTLKAGSIITSGAKGNILAGSTIGGDVQLDDERTALQDVTVKAGSILHSNTQLATGSTIGGNLDIIDAETLAGDMVLAAGTRLAAGSILKAGTVLTDNIAIAGGDLLKAGTVLTGDTVTSGTNYLNSSMTLKSGSVIESQSILASTQTSSSGATATTSVGDVEKFTLADVNVTSQEGAQTAISIADSALKNLDRIRSDLGSTQNQLTSTIANISVTRVNIFAAESSIRDVDFAQESSTFSKMQVLMQASTFAMSQANASSQNVLSLLQG